MKLRLRSNTIRLRLLQDEVARLGQGETITETLPTPTPFHFSVTPTATSALAANFNGQTLRIEVPADWASNWAHNDVVGRHESSAGLDILIEKDWACTTPRTGDENTGTYPNPTALR